ncbi:hypothetical protein TNCT_733011 [Trichonephila clavata]|uniref:Uncharacterized protein n=1 Tax=Trichonephila clavata TaxID=2740835 RepID=A0A8X6KEA0_TRICU|nr:hypothetical protein TNCT_733011 [Trichonephila clavata]
MGSKTKHIRSSNRRRLRVLTQFSEKTQRSPFELRTAKRTEKKEQNHQTLPRAYPFSRRIVNYSRFLPSESIYNKENRINKRAFFTRAKSSFGGKRKGKGVVSELIVQHLVEFDI